MTIPARKEPTQTVWTVQDLFVKDARYSAAIVSREVAIDIIQKTIPPPIVSMKSFFERMVELLLNILLSPGDRL
jgi:hypothetical protein